MISATIDVTKIDKTRLFEGKERNDGTRGKFLSIVLKQSLDGVDKYGNDGFIVEDVTREERAAGTRGTILGNWRRLLTRVRSIPEDEAIAPPRKSDADLPF